ncbi:hypothetical protein ACFL0W_05170 [Nanoarchaeota archaeon]
MFSKHNKKAQGISMSVIVVAAIALLVLVVLAIIFLGRTSTFTAGVSSCGNNGGTCVESEDQCEGQYKKIIDYECPGADPDDPLDDGKCCLDVRNQ